jgi:hypothetical protein
MARRPSTRSVGNIILIALLSGVLVTQAIQAVATHQPADKVAAAGSEVQELGPAAGSEVILSERFKISSPSDLLLGLTLECSIITDLFNTGNSTQSVEATIKTWVTLDGTIVPVSTDDATETGRVVFCNRAHRQELQEDDTDDSNDDIEQFQRTRHANSFNWLALNVGVDCPDPQTDPETFCYDTADNGNNIIDLEVNAELTTTAACTSFDPNDQNCATGFVGHRTITVEPTHASNHETVDPTDEPTTPPENG